MSEKLKSLAGKREILAKVEKLFAALECKNASLSILFTDDKEMRQLNRAYRGKDKSTDVLSFAAIDAAVPKVLHSNQTRNFLGDLVISVNTLLRQAKEYSQTPESELNRLLIHGFLHLLGYEHENVSRAEAAKMRKLEAKLAPLLS